MHLKACFVEMAFLQVKQYSGETSFLCFQVWGESTEVSCNEELLFCGIGLLKGRTESLNKAVLPDDFDISFFNSF